MAQTFNIGIFMDTANCLISAFLVHSASLCPKLLQTPPKGGLGFLMSPPCMEFQGCQFDPTFLYISSLFFLPSPVTLSSLSFSAFGPFS